MGDSVNTIPGEHIVQLAFAYFFGVIGRGKRDIGQNATMLGAITRNSVKLWNSHFELATAQACDILHRPFTKTLAANDQCSTVVLKSSC